MSKAEKTTVVPKSYPSVKTIVMRENHPKSKREIGTRLGVWSYDLESPLTLKDGDQVLIKSSFIDTAPGDAGLITVSDDEVAALSITSGLYWQDSGCGQPIEAFATGFNGPDVNPPTGSEEQTGNPTFNADLQFIENGPLPRMSQVLQSEAVITTPNARNYICQNTTDDFGNTILYLNTNTAFQQNGGSVVGLLPPVVPGTNPPQSNWTKASYVTEKNVRTTAVGGNPPAGGMDLRVDIIAGTPATSKDPAVPAVITACTVNTEFSSGYGYNLEPNVNIIQAGAVAAGLVDQAITQTVNDVVGMALEFVPNKLYNPGQVGHEYNDYTMQNAVDSLIPVTDPPTPILGYPTLWQNPGAIPLGTYPFFVNELNRVANICQLKVQTDTDDNSLMYVYSYSFSQGKKSDGTTAVDIPHVWTNAPDPATQSIATIEHSFNSATGKPTFTFTRNDNWDKDATLFTGGVVPAGHESQGWFFSATAVADGKINFNAGQQTGFFRVCLGMWLWVWDPGQNGGKSETFPAIADPSTGSSQDNNYAINLEYYEPGVSIPGGTFTRSKKAAIRKLWKRAPNPKKPALNNYYDPQFAPYVDTTRANVGFNKQTPDSDGFPAPESQFPTPPPVAKKPGRKKNPAYPQSGTGGTCVPCWFGNMADSSSDDARTRDRSTWEPFIYDSTPWITHDSVKGDDSYNFQPFRMSCDNLWLSGKNEMAGYPFAGIVCQDSRGPITANPIPGQPPKGNTAVPGVWTGGPQSKETTCPTPPFVMTHACVLSKPFVPGSTRHMTARKYTTVLKDIPSGNVGGVDLTLKGGTFTYAGWARRLTDILNQVPPRRSAAAGVGFNGQSNNPDNPKQLKNVPTFTTTRLLTDTIELGYQGLQFPSNRKGNSWGVAGTREVITLEIDGTTPTTVQDSTSEQPYWMAETGGAIFRWKEGVTDPIGTSVIAATVDPAPITNRQPPQVYGNNGPKYAGAESFSIVFNEASSAFEIVQMHSNMYSPTSGAIITRQFQSGFAALPYTETLGDLNIADQDGGVFLTDWQPASIWHTKMNMNPNTLVHTGGDFSSGPNDFSGQFSSFNDQLAYPNLTQVAGHKVNLIPGLNITGNFLSSTALIDKRVNVPSTPGARRATDFLGGTYQTPEPNFDLEVETDTPVTILGLTITPADISDPFFLVELSGINRNEIYGLEQDNKLISQVVGRYFAVGSYTQGNADGSISYTHRGEPMLLSELGIRILDSNGNEIDGGVLNGSSAVIVEIASQDVSLVEESVK